MAFKRTYKAGFKKSSRGSSRRYVSRSKASGRGRAKRRTSVRQQTVRLVIEQVAAPQVQSAGMLGVGTAKSTKSIF